MPSTVSIDGIVTVRDIIEGIEWLFYVSLQCEHYLGSSLE